MCGGESSGPRPASRGRTCPLPPAQGRAGQGSAKARCPAEAAAALGPCGQRPREMRLRLEQVLPALCLGAAFPLLWYAVWQGSRGNDLDMYQDQLLQLQQRLLYAEKENKKRSHELSSALDEIKRIVARRTSVTRNHTGDTKWKELKLPIHLTNIYYYLPHLQKHEDAISPNVIFGQQRTGVSLVMGIPTVKREKQNYLIDTLNSLLYELSEEQKKDCVIIIFIAEVDAEYVKSVAESVKTSFPREVQSGVLEVISPPASYYPDLSNLKETLGDSEDRVRWRTKQNLDYSFLMLYAQPKGTFYLQLEDDIIAKSDYIESIESFAAQQSQDWMILEFSQLGFIGKLFKSEDLPLIVEFFLMFYKDKPIDWLIDHLLWVKLCNPEKDATHCEMEKSKLRIRAKPSLFQHMGIHSSLAGKIQNLKETLRKELADNGSKFNYPATKDGYLKIGTFENGIAEGSISQSIGRIQAIRLSVTSDSPVWAILSEVLIKTSEN
ncbi:alpha-1,3-mannosyl-glycoprotein 4-beta-N-acetylglucosaminyltransferase-like protein MGAT4D isoform 3-T5 [Sylvia borin]